MAPSCAKRAAAAGLNTPLASVSPNPILCVYVYIVPAPNLVFIPPFVNPIPPPSSLLSLPIRCFISLFISNYKIIIRF